MGSMRSGVHATEGFKLRYVPRPFTGLKLRNVYVDGRRTSVRLEGDMWDALHEIALLECISIADLCGAIFDMKGPQTSFSSAIRSFLVTYYRQAASSNGAFVPYLTGNKGKKNENT